MTFAMAVRLCRFKLSHEGVHPTGARMPSLRPFHKAHFAGKELQSGKKMERAIQPEIPLPDSGTHERVREHPEAIARTGRSSQAVVQVAGARGSRGVGW